jgi:dTDP-4-dehydrorhamnose 3,5-epimerase
MKFIQTKFIGAFLIELQRAKDERGFFARSFCRKEFEMHGLNPAVAQCNTSFNHAIGTLRGMHYQLEPCREVKLVRCISGAIHDVIIDLRPTSPTYRGWEGFELSAENRRALYVPESFAHGYLTLADNTEVFYQVSEFYSPDYERGIRWNDPAFMIHWPITPRIISSKDASHPNFVEAAQRESLEHR